MGDEDPAAPPPPAVPTDKSDSFDGDEPAPVGGLADGLRYDAALVASEDQSTTPNYGTLAPAVQSERFPWHADGRSLRAKVWQNDGDSIPDVDNRYRTHGRVAAGKILHSNLHKVSKDCCTDCCSQISITLHKIRDFNPFFAREIALVARKFGAGVAQFFALWRWLLTLNFICFIWWGVCTIFPWWTNVPTFVDSDPSNAKVWDRNDLGWEYLFGLDRAAMQSFMYYAGYRPYPNMGDYRIGAIWVLSVLATNLISFFAILSKLIASALATSTDHEVQSRRTTAVTCNRRMAELVFADYDWEMGISKEGRSVQVQQLSMALGTVLSDEFANVGTAIFLDSAATPALKGLEDASIKGVARDAVHLKAEYDHRCGRRGEGTAGVAAHAYAVLVCNGGYSRFQAWCDVDQNLANIAKNIEALENQLAVAVASPSSDEEMGQLAANTTGEADSSPTLQSSVQAALFGKKSKREQEIEAKIAAEKELQSEALAIQAAGKPTLDVYHHANNKSGVLLRKSVYVVPCVRDSRSEEIIDVAPIDQWLDYRLSEEEAADVLEGLELGFIIDETDLSRESTEEAEKRKAGLRGKNLDTLQEYILRQKDAEVSAGTDASYAMIGQVSDTKHIPGRKATGSEWADIVLSPTTAKWIEQRNVTKVARYVFSVEHADSIADNSKDGDSCCTVPCMTRIVGLSTTLLLIIGTALSYVTTSVYSTEIMEWTRSTTGSVSLSESAPNLILTSIKTIVPVVVTKLVVLERWSSSEKTMMETLWRVYVIKMMALFYFAYHLKHNVTNAETITTGSYGEYTSCAAATVGYTYLNLVWVNTIVQLVTNIGTYIVPYLIFGTKTEYDHNVVALAYIELFYTQGILWLGMPWSPIIPLIWVALAAADCYFLVWIMDRFCKPSEKTYDGSRAKDLIERMLMVTFFITVIPAMWFLNGDPTTGTACNPSAYDSATGVCSEYLPCGPISRDHPYRYDAMTDYVDTNILGELTLIKGIVEYMARPMVAYMLLVFLIGFCIFQQCLLNRLRDETAVAYDELQETKEDKALLAKQADRWEYNAKARGADQL